MGTLARAPLSGGAPREVLEQVQWADWAPDGTSLAVVRDMGGRNRLELPVGKPLYQTGGWIGHPRVSPKGDLIAFADHPLQGDDSGSLAVVDLQGNKKSLSTQWFTIQGLAWSPDGKEIWFTASKSGTDRTLYATSLDGKQRIVARLPGALMLLDIAKDGRVLLVRATWRRELLGVFANDAKQHELSWLDYTYPSDLSADGKTLLFDEEGGGGALDYSKSGGLTYAVYIRKTDGSPAVLLRRRRSSSVIARRNLGHRPNSGITVPVQTPAHARRRTQRPDQRQHQPQLGPLVPRRKTHPLLRRRARQRRPLLRLRSSLRQKPAHLRGRRQRHRLHHLPRLATDRRHRPRSKGIPLSRSRRQTSTDQRPQSRRAAHHLDRRRQLSLHLSTRRTPRPRLPPRRKNRPAHSLERTNALRPRRSRKHRPHLHDPRRQNLRLRLPPNASRPISSRRPKVKVAPPSAGKACVGKAHVGKNHVGTGAFARPAKRSEAHLALGWRG